MMPYTDHREIAYKLWVETGRDAKKVAELLRQGDPDEEWEPLPSAKPAMVRQWALQQGWAIRQFDDFREMAPDQFAQTRSTYHRLAPPAAQFMGDVLMGALDNIDPRVVRNRIDVAKHITAVAGHLPYSRMDSTQEAAAPTKDYSREIADLSIDELRERVLGADNTTSGRAIASTLPSMTTAPEQSIIEADFGHDREPSTPSQGGSKRT
jgi:hypothetical protein